MSLRVRVDRQRCIGAGNCIFLAPTAFKWREGEFLKADVLDPETIEEEILMHAVISCPTGAIQTERVDDPAPWANDPGSRR
jgi:ferredoxin